MEDLLLLIYVSPLLQLFLQPQWISSFQLTTIVGSYGNPSKLQVQNHVSNIWKVLLRRLGSFLSGAAEEGSMLCGTPTWNNGRETNGTSRVTTAVRTNSDHMLET